MNAWKRYTTLIKAIRNCSKETQREILENMEKVSNQ